MSQNIQHMKEEKTSGSLGKHSESQQTANGSNTGKYGAKRDFVDIIALIRGVQRAEGNKDCFRREQVHCDQEDCFWRQYCLDSHQTSKEEER